MSKIAKYFRRFLPKEITSEDMNVIEENAECLGFDRQLMMENAGAGIADFVATKIDIVDKVALVVCGTGNNGGDGFVAARHLRSLGAKPKVVLLGKPSEIRTRNSELNWSLIENMEDVRKMFLLDISQMPELIKELNNAEFIVDAILGTGVKGNLREPILSVVRAINKVGNMKFAVDTPSGLNPSTGEIHGDAIRADYTITFHKMKKGFKAKKGYTGEVFIKDIGIPAEAEFFTGPGDVRRAIKPRMMYSHKGDYGAVLIVGGSELYSGAPALAALSSLRTGTGIAYVAAPKSVVTSIRRRSADLIVQPLLSDHFSLLDVDLLEGIVSRVRSVVIGPGLGLHRETVQAVPELVKRVRTKVQVVLDADGFKAVKNDLETLEGIVATPHAGEFKSVFNASVGEKWWEKVDEAVKVAKKFNFTLILKGHDTVITDGQKAKVNRWGTPGMAVGGTGDVLSGILAAFLAWKYEDRFHCSAAAVYVHGDAGKRAVKEKGFHILASDVIDKIPEALRIFDKESVG